MQDHSYIRSLATCKLIMSNTKGEEWSTLIWANAFSSRWSTVLDQCLSSCPSYVCLILSAIRALSGSSGPLQGLIITGLSNHLSLLVLAEDCILVSLFISFKKTLLQQKNTNLNSSGVGKLENGHKRKIQFSLLKTHFYFMTEMLQTSLDGSNYNSLISEAKQIGNKPISNPTLTSCHCCASSSGAGCYIACTLTACSVVRCQDLWWEGRSFPTYIISPPTHRSR